MERTISFASFFAIDDTYESNKPPEFASKNSLADLMVRLTSFGGMIFHIRFCITSAPFSQEDDSERRFGRGMYRRHTGGRTSACTASSNVASTRVPDSSSAEEFSAFNRVSSAVVMVCLLLIWRRAMRGSRSVDPATRLAPNQFRLKKSIDTTGFHSKILLHRLKKCIAIEGWMDSRHLSRPGTLTTTKAGPQHEAKGARPRTAALRTLFVASFLHFSDRVLTRPTKQEAERRAEGRRLLHLYHF